MIVFTLHAIFFLVHFSTAHDHHERGCGAHDMNPLEIVKSQLAETEFFGRTVEEMGRFGFSKIVQKLSNRRSDRRLSVSEDGSDFKLVDVPLVFHILPNQDAGSSGSPSLTQAQAEYLTNYTNDRFNIYDRETKTSAQFINFVLDGVVVHEDYFYNRDAFEFLRQRRDTETSKFIKKVDDWEFKFHVVVCDMFLNQALAGHPLKYGRRDSRHSLALLDYRTLPCRDAEGNFLCELTDGEEIDKTHWARTAGSGVAHELGHTMGLLHTFYGGCFGTDLIPDTPAESITDVSYSNGCPGLLPYDKDRDPYDKSTSDKANEVVDENSCGSASNVCGATCGSCVQYLDLEEESGGEEYEGKGLIGNIMGRIRGRIDNWKTDILEVTTIEMVKFPACCQSGETILDTPRDTCPFQDGIDPRNNVMSYAPDMCMQEFTPGQMARMMAVTRRFRKYTYCNYADVEDPDRCAGVPCSSSATSPNCL